MQNNGIVFAALIVIVLMGAVIIVQQEQIRSHDVNNLPECNYSMIINMEGQGHYGYWVQTGLTGENDCITKMNDRGQVVDLGL